MKKYLKKFVGVLLSLIMLCSGFETNVLADEITAYFSVEYIDEVRDPNTFLDLLENGNKVDAYFEKVSEENNIVEYKITGLDSLNIYALRVRDISGYSYNNSLFTFNKDYTLDENIKLSLDTYNVTGRVSFDDDGISKEEYFNTVFKDYDVTSNGDYTFIVNNLYTSDVNGNVIYYTIDLSLEGYSCNIDTITIDGDKELDIHYSSENTNVLLANIDDYTAIRGNVKWSDSNNLMNNRPLFVKLALYRSTSSITKEKVGTIRVEPNAVSFSKADGITNRSGTISGQQGSGGEWSYQIDNLDKHASDGQKWIYTIGEESKVNYYDVGIVNKYNITYTLTKTSFVANVEWSNINPDIEKYSVELSLLVKEGEDGTWTWASDYFGGSVSTSKTISSTGSSVTFTDLPKYVKNAEDSTELVYAVRETKINGVTIKLNGTEYAGGGEFKVENTNNSTVKNSLKSTVSLCVTNKWDDQDNKYGLRDLNWTVNYYVYRRVDGGVLELVKDSKGNAYVFSVSGSGNKASNTLSDLPANNPSGKPYSLYAAMQISKSGSVAGGYYSGSYESTITGRVLENGVWQEIHTNTLKTVDIKVKKVWNDSNEKLRSTVELTVKQNGKDLSFKTKVSVSASSVYMATVIGLPKFDENGNLYTYTVSEDTVDGYMNPVYDGTTVTNNITSFNIDTLDDKEYTIEFTLSGNGYSAIWRKANGVVSTLVKKGDEEIYSGLDIQGLPLGTYTLSETSVPYGYKKIEDTKVTLVDNGGTLNIESQSGALSFENNILSIKLDKVDPVDITISSSSEDGVIWYDISNTLTLAASISPNDAYYSMINWSSEDKDIASVVKNDDGTSVTVKGLKTGETNIIASVTKSNGDVVSKSYRVIVKSLKNDSSKVVTCKEANGKNWTWSEPKKACVYKVTNTSSK